MKKRPLHLKLLQLHRWIGLFASILVLILSITGLLLEHTTDFELDKRFITSSLVLDHYGIEPDAITHYQTNQSQVAHAGKHLYLDSQALSLTSTSLCGAVETGFGFALCVSEGVALLDKSGQLIEVLEPGLGLPAPATGVGLTSGKQVVLLSHDGNWLADQDFLLWQEYPAPPSVISQRSDITDTDRKLIETHNLSHEISWERLLLDLHSGRLLGKAGVYAMDFAAIALIYLALSGIWVWWKRQRR